MPLDDIEFSISLPEESQGLPFVRVVYDGRGYDSERDGDLGLPMTVSLGSQLRAGSFSFTVDNSDFDFNNTFKVFRDVEIFLGDGRSKARKVMTGLLLGRDRQHPSRQVGWITLDGLDYRYPLMRKYVNKDYVNNISPCVSGGCETSEIIKDIMNDHAEGQIGFNTHVRSSNKFYASGGSETYPIINRVAWDVISRMALESGMIAYVDEEKELHLEEIGLTSSGVTLTDNPVGSGSTRGTGEFQLKSISANKLDARRLYSRVTGFGDKDTNILRQSDNLDRQEDWGWIIEDQYQDKNITDGNVLKEIITARLQLISDDTRDTYNVSTDEFAYARPGQSLKLTDAKFGFTAVEFAVQGVKWTYSADLRIRTEFQVSQFPHEYLEWFQRVAEEITFLKGQEAGTGTASLIKLFRESFEMTSGVQLVTNVVSSAYMAGSTSLGKAGGADPGFSVSSSNVEVDTT